MDLFNAQTEDLFVNNVMESLSIMTFVTAKMKIKHEIQETDDVQDPMSIESPILTRPRAARDKRPKSKAPLIMAEVVAVIQ